MADFHLIRKEEVGRTLGAPPRAGKNMLPPFDLLTAEEAPLRILEDHKITNPPEIHKTEGDLWHCIEGEADFTCGGTIVNPREVEGYNGNEITGEGIKGGESMKVSTGDWLWIPPEIAHQHGSKSTARFIIIKIKQP